MGALPTPTLLTAVLLAVCVGLSSEDAAHWSYEGDGPQHWSGKCQNGKHQSPIDLGSSGIVESNFEALAFINYDIKFNGTITNNGHTVQLQVSDNPHNIMLTGGGLNRIYSLEQIHFHWKSEHTITGRRYPLEVHFVHFDKSLKRISDAVKKKGGIAVIGVMFHEEDSGNHDIQVLDQVKDLKYNAKKNIQFSPKHLLPDDTTQFYRYYGSLTTPGCDESVVWTVLSNSHPLSRKQISFFQKVTDSDGKFLHINYRPLQDQNDRIIYFQSSPPHQVNFVNSAWTIKNSLVTMSILLLVSKYI